MSSIYIYNTTWRNIVEDGYLLSHLSENPISHQLIWIRTHTHTHTHTHTQATVKYASQSCYLKPANRQEYKDYNLQFTLLDFIWF